jgi:hypothetical protein
MPKEATGDASTLQLLVGVHMRDGDWSNLMAAAQAGNADAYHLLLIEVCEWLRRYYFQRLPASIVEETVQETLIVIHKKRSTYDPSRPFGPWLAAIARYKWIDCLRTLAKKPIQAFDAQLASIGDAGIVAGSCVAPRAGLSMTKLNIHRGLRRLIELVHRRPVNERHYPPG